MSDSPSDAAPREGNTPTLVYGTGAAAVPILGAALGRREQQPFGWVHCAPAPSDLPPAARELLETASGGFREFLKDPRELTLPELRVRRLSQFFLDEPMTLSFEVRLVAYLGLPALVQRMVSRIVSTDGRSMIVITGIERVPPTVALECFARPEARTTMRREGVSVIATFLGTPPEALRRAFPRVFRVDGPLRARWQDAQVVPEEGHHPSCGIERAAPLQEWVAYLAPEPAARVPSASRGSPTRR